MDRRILRPMIKAMLRRMNPKDPAVLRRMIAEPDDVEDVRVLACVEQRLREIPDPSEEDIIKAYEGCSDDQSSEEETTK
jgi:hypothetical protein